LLGKAIASGVASVKLVNTRDYAMNKHRKVDDTPYGGGAGMVMMVEPIALATEAIRMREPDSHVVLLSARGRLFDAQVTHEYVQKKSITLICGHYEGIDERVAEHVADESLRIGNYVLSGGEPAALVVIDALVRRLPGFMGNSDSLMHESFDHGIAQFEHAQYTRPEDWRGHKVPDVLLSGNHKKIEDWRKKNAEEFSPQES